MRLTWDQVGERLYETGVDHGVLYVPDNTGAYELGHAWNGLVNVTESPTGAESSPQYADNIKYLNLVSAEQFGATIEAFTYPDEFARFDGTADVGGVLIGQQTRGTFGLAYRTQVGNDVEGTDFGYKLHLVYGAMAAPSEKAYGTINESPEALTFSWELSTTPVEVPGVNPVTGKPFKPTATLVIDSTKVDAAQLAILEDILYGTAGADPRLPLPGEILDLFGAGAVVVVETEPPTYDDVTDIVTIPATVGVQYSVDGVDVEAGAFGPIAEDVVVTARAEAGYRLSEVSDTDWTVYHA